MTRVEEEAPLAVVGISCRLPGAPHLEAFWDLLAGGRSAIGETPPERWRLAGRGSEEGLTPAERGARFGAFLDDVDRFDAEFFGISPREAAAMDPQQRLALELGWEVLEDAGIPAEKVRGRHASVFLGAISADYAGLAQRLGPGSADRHAFTGLQRGLIANRVSHFLGLTGPSLTVDAAQSSSLVAVHLACQSLRYGESELALAGGVHLNLDPAGALAAARFGALSPDGRCRVFDAGANGYVRGEGGGIVAIKPLAAARADGDCIHCLIHGSAVSSDGDGAALAVPSRAGQEAAIAAAWERAGADPADAGYVELHGTGTPVGDPVEAAALGGVVGVARRPGEPLLVGSAKSNLGHLEGAAGIAGLIKTALAIARRRVPASLGFERPNPEIPFEELGLRVNEEPCPWPGDRMAVAGVSSFGIGGTNCHAVLGEAPWDAGKEEIDSEGSPPLPGLALLPLSAQSEPALRDAAARLAAHMEREPTLEPLDVAYSLATGRAALERRAAPLAGDRDQLLAALRSLAAGEPQTGLAHGTARSGGLAFLFAGQGAQRPGMGRELHAAFPAFADAFDEACEALAEPLADVVFGTHPRAAELLDRTEFTQPALFALEVALFRLLERHGLRPDCLSGHSVGEIVAAHVAGVLSLQDAGRLVAARGALMGALPACGAMLAIAAPEREVAASLVGRERQLAIAAVNAPRSVVVSGEEAAVADIERFWRERGARATRLAVSHAFHSPLMEPMLDEFARVVADLELSPPRIPLVSNLSGELLDPERAVESGYWVEHVRRPVRFAQGVEILAAAGAAHFVELGPGGALCALARECLDGNGDGFAFVPSMRAGRPEPEAFAAALAQTQVAGAELDWQAFFAGAGAKRVSLPTYPFQRRRHWLFSDPAGGDPSTRVASSPPVVTDRGGTLLNLVRAEAAVVLGHASPEHVPPDSAFKDLGFDSLAAVELRNRLAEATGLELDATVAFDHPTAAQLTAHMSAQLD